MLVPLSPLYAGVHRSLTICFGRTRDGRAALAKVRSVPCYRFLILPVSKTIPANIHAPIPLFLLFSLWLFLVHLPGIALTLPPPPHSFSSSPSVSPGVDTLTLQVNTLGAGHPTFFPSTIFFHLYRLPPSPPVKSYIYTPPIPPSNGHPNPPSNLHISCFPIGSGTSRRAVLPLRRRAHRRP